jgi:adenylate kinase
MRLLFLGMPYVGKGTYAGIMQKELGIPHISMGDILRDEVNSGSNRAVQLKQTMDSGALVSDDIIIELIKERIAKDDCKNGFILDGFPRTTNQAQELHELTDITHVLHFQAHDEVIVQRASGRIVCTECKEIFNKVGKIPKQEGTCDHCGTELIQRDDDKPENVKKRLEVFKENTAPLIDYYNDKGLLVEVVINKNIDEIGDKVRTTIRDFLEGNRDTIGKID